MVEKGRFYTVKALADLLAVKPITIYRMVSRGQLPAVRVGKSIRFDPDDIAAFLDTVRVNPPAGRKKAGKTP
jgi:excisionase family DNA binding protein